VGGHHVEIASHSPELADAAAEWQVLAEEDFPPNSRPVRGEVMPYDADAASRAVSPHAQRVGLTEGLTEVWRDPADAGRHWLIDERWGLCEIDRCRGRWRVWVLPDVPDGSLLDHAVLLPMAELLRLGGTHLLPAASVEADGWGVLMLCPFDCGPEINRLLDDDFRVVGRHWTLLEQAGDGVILRQLPGGGAMPHTAWAKAAATLIVHTGRRGCAEAVPIFAATATLRDAWPMPNLTPARPSPNLAATLARSTVYDVTLSHDPDEFAALLDLLRPTQPTAGQPRTLRAA
jgi:hypothetical protein